MTYGYFIILIIAKNVSEMFKISDHINGGVAGENDHPSTELDYDFPVPHISREGSKER